MAAKTKATPETNGRIADHLDALDKAHDLKVLPVLRAKVQIAIKGTTPLICNAMSERIIQTLVDGQGGGVKPKKGERNPEADFKDTLHYMPGSSPKDFARQFESIKSDKVRPDIGFPASGFKKTAKQGARGFDKKTVSMTSAGMSVFVLGDDDTDLVRLQWEKIKMRRDPVMRSTGGADLTYRAEIHDWSAVLQVVFCPVLITAERVINLFHFAGAMSGVGSMRPSSPDNPGPYGTFEVVPGE